MIATGGEQFRTLAQPIYVNGKKVKEVWANGNMVYPVISRANYLKVRGRMTISKCYTRPQVGGMFKDTVTGYLISGESSFLPEWVSAYAISVTFIAIYRAKGGYLTVSDDWFEVTSGKYEATNYNGYFNPLAPASEGDLPLHLDSVYGKKIEGEFTVPQFQCSIMSEPIPIPPYYIHESKGGGFIFDTPDSYSMVETIPDAPSVLGATMWNGERMTQIAHSYVNPMYPDASLYISSYTTGGIGISMYGLTVEATNKYYGGSYFYDGYYSLKKTERTTLNIRSTGSVRIPVTDILYAGMEEDAPDWAKTISDRDFYD